MAETNTSWPSEDEDFDAVHDGKPVTVTDFDEPEETPATNIKAVTVVSDDDEPAEEAAHIVETEPETTPEAAEEPVTEHQAEPTDDVEVDHEPESEQESETPSESEHQYEYEDETEAEAATEHEIHTEHEHEIAETETEAEPELSDEPADEEAEPIETNHFEPESEPEPEPEAVETTEAVEPESDSAPHEPAAPLVTSSAAVSPPVSTGKKGKGKAFGQILLIVLVVAAFVGLGVYTWKLSTDNQNLKKQVDSLNANPQAVIQKQTQSLLKKVNALYQLPTDETPTVANVSDADAAKKQSPFFANAQNGDRVLMYAKHGEAILYRPSTDKIVLVAPLTFNNPSSASTDTTPATTTKR